MSGFTFGAPSNQASASPNFGFGAPKTTTATTSFGFGTSTPTATTTTAPTFGFMTPANTAASTVGFGYAATPTTAQTAPPGLNFSTSVANTAAKQPSAPTLAYGGLSTSTSTVPTGVGSFFSKPATTIAGTNLNFGTLTTQAQAIAPPPFVGLGGVDVSSTQPKAGDSKQENVKVKETQVPDEIAKTVEGLKTHIKTQKTLSSDIGRTSTSKLTNVSSEIMNLQWLLQEISNSVEANYNQIKLLRRETSKAIQSVEMAQRTQDTPAGLQFENTAPFQFFQNLIAKYENDLVNFRQQISLTERHMRSVTSPQNISPEDLKRGFKQINESFISLAGRLQATHQKVEAQKEQYLNLRKHRLRDNSNVFSKLDNPEIKVDTSRITSGPTPFSNISAISSFGKTFSNSSTATAGNTSQSMK